MIIRELLTKWGFQVDHDKIDKFDKAIVRAKSDVALVAKGLGLAAAAFSGIVIWSAKTGDAIAKTADKLGLGIEELQRYRYAADRAGVAQGTVDMAMQRFGRRTAEAAAGMGEAKAALQEMGVALKGADGKMRSTGEILGDVSEYFKTSANSSDRLRLAFKLFDSEGVALVNMLKGGKTALSDMMMEADALGSVIGEEQARNSERFVDSMTMVKFALMGLKNAIGGAFLPEGTRLILDMVEWFKANRELIQANLLHVMKLLVGTLRMVAQGFSSLIVLMGPLVRMFADAERAVALLRLAIIWIIATKAVGFFIAMGGAVLSLAKAFRSAAIAASLMNATIAVIPALIGLAIAMIWLLYDDIATFKRGGDSMFGDLAKWLTELRDSNYGFGEDSVFGEGLVWTMERVEDLLKNLNEVYRIITNLGNQSIIMDAIKGIWSRSVPDVVENTRAIGSEVFRNTERSRGLLNSIRVNSPVTINIPQGGTMEQGEALIDKLNAWWDDKLRPVIQAHPVR